MKASGPFREGLCAALARRLSAGRSSRFDPARHGALRREELLAEAARLGAGAEAEARRGRLLRLAGRLEDAEAAFARALALRPRLPEALAGRWELRLSAGGRDDGGISSAAAAEPRRAVWRAWRGLARLDSDPAAARADLTAASRDAGPAGVLGLAGLCAASFRGRRRKEALARAEEAAARAPGEGWLRRLAARARAVNGDEPGFLAAFDAEILRDEGMGTLFMAVDRTGHGTPEDLLERVERELARRGKLWWLLALRGDLRRVGPRRDDAGSAADWEEASAAAPRPGWTLAHLARARLSAGDAPGALKAAVAATAAEKRCGWIRAWEGAVRRKLDDRAGARRALDAAVVLDPDYEFSYAWRGALALQEGRREDAARDLALAAALGAPPPFVQSGSTASVEVR